MSARLFFMIMLLGRLAYRGGLTILQISHRKKPLPPEVADIYDTERYRTFMAYKSEIIRAAYIKTACTMAYDILLLFSPVYAAIERTACQQVYLVVFLTWLMYWVIGTIIDIPFAYYDTFHIEEKYGQNKRTRKVFWKDLVLEILEEIPISLGFVLLFAFIGQHLSGWTHNFEPSIVRAAGIGGAVAAAVFLFSLGAALIQLTVMKKQYTFTPLSDGELRDKIKNLMSGCRKKVAEIYVYDESKKSVSKNAFLLKLLWHREFGIADNFINENAERELLAVLSHEIGHLKHKKNLLNYTFYAILAMMFLAGVLCIYNPAPLLWINQWTRNSFGLTVNNYYILSSLYSVFLAPVIWLFSVFNNWKQRSEEREADMEAVNNGYGEDLIGTFKKLSSDELVDVNPHPAVEFLEYTHPGMYQRIRYIRDETAKLRT